MCVFMCRDLKHPESYTFMDKLIVLEKSLAGWIISSFTLRIIRSFTLRVKTGRNCNSFIGLFLCSKSKAFALAVRFDCAVHITNVSHSCG